MRLALESMKIFLELARDAGNWNGTPLVGGNVCITKEQRGNLTELKRKGLVFTQKEEGHVWLFFTEAGATLAKQHGVDISKYVHERK